MAGQYTYPNVTIYSNRLVLTDVPILKVTPKQTGNINVKDHRAATLSAGGKKSIKKFLSAWFDCYLLLQGRFQCTGKYDLFFLTLTLPSKQIHCDNTINREALQEFLKEAQRMYGGKYFWVGERQKNGNLHYHILYDRDVPPLIIRRIWNSKINRLGYVDRYQSKMKDRYKNGFFIDKNDKADKETQYKRYMYGIATDWKSPNSTDRKRVTTHKKLMNYMTKYVSKNDFIMCGKCWGRSQGLTDIVPYSDFALNGILDIARKNYTDVIRMEKCTVVKTDSFTDIIQHVEPVRNYYLQMANKFKTCQYRGI